MSDVIDSRVVELQFDNKDFEANTKQSMLTLEKLKTALDFDGISKSTKGLLSSLSGVNDSISKIDANPIAQTFNKSLSLAESYLQLFNYKVANFVQGIQQKMVGMIITDPIRDGFKEYETQLDSVQTILANTQDKGTTLGEVNSALKELNDYADKTIYNFTQMTQNIGRFTAAGLDLDVSTKAIQGISNLAAVSGSTSQQASTAMYQLSQALSTGALKLQDWNSVVNAGMGGQVFQKALQRTAEAHGVAVDQIIEKAGSFRESLSKGWITTEILSETLNQFAGAYNDAELAQMGYTEEQIKSIQDLAQTAEDAATKVKTFTQLVDTTKEALGSGWTTTWQYIFGDFEQAKELWTSISDYTNNVINTSSDRRNNFLASLMPSNWDRTNESIQAAGYSIDDFKEKLSSVINDQTKGELALDDMIKEYGSLGEAIRQGAVASSFVEKTIKQMNEESGKGLFSDLAKGAGFEESSEQVKKIQQALSDVGVNLDKYGIDGKWGEETQKAIEQFQKDNGLEITGKIDDDTLAKLNEQLTSLGKDVLGNGGLISLEWVDEIDKLGGRDLIINSLKNAFNGLLSVITPIQEAFSKVFSGPTVDGVLFMLQSIEQFTDALRLSEEDSANLKNTFAGLFTIVRSVLDTTVDLIAGVFSSFSGSGSIISNILIITSAISDWVQGTDAVIEKTGVAAALINVIKQAFVTISTLIGSVVSALADPFKGQTLSSWLLNGFDKLRAGLKSLWPIITSLVAEIKIFVTDVLKNVDLTDVLDFLDAGLFAVLLNKLRKMFTGIDSLEDIFNILFGKDGDAIGDMFKKALDSFAETLDSFAETLDAQAIKDIAISIGILAASLWVLSTIDAKSLGTALVAVSALIWEIVAAIKFLSGETSNLSIKDAFSNLLGGFNTAILATSLISLAAAVLILSFAMKNLASLDWEGIGKGLVGIGGLMAELAIFAKVIDGVKIKPTTAISTVLIASAIIILVQAVKQLANIEWDGIGKGLAGIGGLLVELAIFAKVMDGVKIKLGTALSFVLLAASIVILVQAMKQLANLSWEGIGKGLAGIGGALAEILVFFKLLQGTKGSFGGAVSALILVAAINALVPALQSIANLSWEGIGKGLAGIGGALAEILVFFKLLDGTKGKLGGAISVVIIVAALNMLVPVLQKIGKLKWSAIAKGLVTIGVAMAVFAVSMAIMGNAGTLAGALGLLVIVGALNLLIPVIKTLGSMDIATIAIGIGAMAAAMVIIGGLAAVLGLAAPLMLAAAVALGVLGLAFIAIGAGIGAIALGLYAVIDLAARGATSITNALITITTGIAGALPQIVSTLAEGFVLIISSVVGMLPSLADSIFPALIETLQKLTAYAPQLTSELIELAKVVITGLLDGLPDLFSSIFSSLGGIATSIIDGIFGEGTTAKIGGFLDNAFESIKTALSDFPTKVSNFFSTFWDEGGAADIIKSAVSGFIDTLWRWITDGIAWEIDALFGDGTSEQVSQIVESAVGWIKDIPNEIYDFFASFFDGSESGAYGKIGAGVRQLLHKISHAINTAFDTVVDALFGTGTAARLEFIVSSMVGWIKDIPSKIYEFVTEFFDSSDGGVFGRVSAGIRQLCHKISHGISEGFSNAIDSLFGEGTADRISSTVESIVGWVKDIPTKIGEFFTTFFDDGGAAETIASSISSFGSALWDAITNPIHDIATTLFGADGENASGDGVFSEIINGIVTAFNALPKAIAGAIGEVVGAFESGEWTTMTQSLQTGIDSIILGEDNISKLDSTVEAIDEITAMVDSIHTVVTSGANSSLGTLGQDLVTFSTYLDQFYTYLDEMSTGKFVNLGTGLQALVDAAVKINEASSNGNSLGDAMSTFVGDENSGLISITQSLSEAITSIGESLSGIAEAMSTNQESISASVESLVGSLKSLKTQFDATFDGMDTTASTAMSGLTSALDVGNLSVDTSGLNISASDIDMSGIATAASSAVSSATSVLSGASSSFSSAGSADIVAFAIGMNSQGGFVSSIASAIAARATSGLQSQYGSAQQAGSYFGTGYAIGINSQTSFVYNTAYALARRAVQAAADAQKSASPAKETIKLGGYFGEGYGIGITNMAGYVAAAAGNLAEVGLEGVKMAGQRISDALNGNLDMSPTITPVVDLSSVQDSATALDGILSSNSTLGALSDIGYVNGIMSNHTVSATNDDVVNAIGKLRNEIGNLQTNQYTINGITYDDGSGVSNAIGELIHAAVIEGRI